MLFPNLLKEMGGEYGLRNTPRGNEPAKLAVSCLLVARREKIR